MTGRRWRLFRDRFCRSFRRSFVPGVKVGLVLGAVWYGTHDLPW